MTVQAPVDRGSLRLQWPDQMAKALDSLVEMLYPYNEEESPEVIWLRDIEKRYPLTKLGQPARQALAQAQRINRARREHRLLGLCEFNIGLIYLHYRADYHHALTQFGEARRQWLFESQTAAVCLTHYAQGLAHYHEQEYEAALRQFSLTEQLLRRVSFNSNQQANKFLDTLIAYLTEDRKTLLNWMWPAEDESEPQPAPQTAPPATPRTTTPEPVATEAPVTVPTPEPPPPLADNGQPTGPPPPINQQETPVYGHELRNKRYEWYEVIQQDERFLNIPQGTWLLVDKQAKIDDYKPGVLLIISDEIHCQAGLREGIIVKTRTASQIGQRITLLGKANIDHATFSEDIDLQLDSQQQFKIKLEDILGMVVGIWQYTEH
jgi:hypothetical protein